MPRDGAATQLAILPGSVTPTMSDFTWARSALVGNQSPTFASHSASLNDRPSGLMLASRNVPTLRLNPTWGRSSETLIPASASEADVLSALQALDTLGSAFVYGTILSVSVGMAGGTSLCAAGAEVTTSIEVRCAYGNLPSFAFVGSVMHSDGTTAADVAFSDSKGNKENEYCANHGVCDFGTGSCICDRNTTMFPNEWYWWESSDGYGGPGGRPDCGYQRVEQAANAAQSCPVGVVFADQNLPTYESFEEVCTRAGHGFIGRM